MKLHPALLGLLAALALAAAPSLAAPLPAQSSIHAVTVYTDRAIVTRTAPLDLAATGTVGAWGWIGVVPLLTGVVGFCPVYPLLGLNTCPMKKA